MNKILLISMLALGTLLVGCSDSLTDTIYYESFDISLCETYSELNKVEGRYNSGVYEIKLNNNWVPRDEIMRSCNG